ncbi:MAG TPA: thiamine pyrophosphate-dependent enzyme [Kineosporiaceae bacterium]|nr:thiamine pyrophosphate-dependent enzyme [Kineosporiaceae bacterium]
MAHNAGEAIVETLAARGVRRFYTVPGESFLEVLDAVEQDPRLQLVSCRHESGAAFMAEAEGKLTGRPAVAMGTRAVGAANLAIGVETAWEDCTPLIALCGQVETGSLGRRAFQEVDLPAFLGQVSVHAETLLRADRAAEAAARAHWAATSGRPGPAVLALPADVLAEPCPPDAPLLVPGRRARTRPDDACLDDVAALLASAARPVAVLGLGAQQARADVIALVERFGLGVYTAFRRQDAFPNSHPQYLGHLSLGTPPELVAALAGADLVLALGARLDDTTTQGFRLPGPTSRVIHVDLDPRALRAPVTLAWSISADVAGFAQALLDRVQAVAATTVAVRDWSAEHTTYLRLSTPPEGAGGGNGSAGTGPAAGLHPGQVLGAMRRRLPADVVLTNDAGNFSVFCHRYWRFEHPRTQLGPISGAMGYGVPAAVGAGLAEPGRPVVALAGDGGFLMTGQELETAVRQGVPVLVVVFQNGLYGTIAMHQAREFGRTAAVDIGPVDLAGYARSLGAQAVTLDAPQELDDAFAEASRFDQPRVIVVRTDPDVLTPAATLSGLLGGQSRAGSTGGA